MALFRLLLAHPEALGGLLFGFSLHDSCASQRRSLNRQNLRARCQKKADAARKHRTLDDALGRPARPAPGTLRSAVLRHRAVPEQERCKHEARSTARRGTVGSSKAVWKQVFSSGRPSWPRAVVNPKQNRLV